MSIIIAQTHRFLRGKKMPVVFAEVAEHLPAKNEQIKAHRSKGAEANLAFAEVACEEQRRYAKFFAGKKRKEPNAPG